MEFEGQFERGTLWSPKQQLGHLRSYPYVLDPFFIRGNRFEATILRKPDHGHKDLLKRPILDDHVSKATVKIGRAHV